VLASDSGNAFQDALGAAGVSGVKVESIVEDQAPFQRRYDPTHPDADKDGFVAMPNVDTPEEMVNMLAASRAYQANLTAIGLIRDLVQRALELGK
jgi:flagellar basal-body rod protein FlgC